MRPTKGMPRVDREGRRWMLHRYLRYRIVGKDTELCLHVACKTPGCLNPFHMELSAKRGMGQRRYCPNGHRYTPKNTLREGRFRCRTCHEARNARRRKYQHASGTCRRGHKFYKDNTYWYTRADGKRFRRCRKCQLENQRRYRERKDT